MYLGHNMCPYMTYVPNFSRLFRPRRRLNFPDDLCEGYSGVISASLNAQGFLDTLFKSTYLVSPSISYALRFLHLTNIYSP